MGGNSRLYLSKRGRLIIENKGPQLKPSNFRVYTMPVKDTATIAVVKDNQDSPDFVRPTGA